jgi:hypothetical protein
MELNKFVASSFRSGLAASIVAVREQDIRNVVAVAAVGPSSRRRRRQLVAALPNLNVTFDIRVALEHYTGGSDTFPPYDTAESLVTGFKSLVRAAVDDGSVSATLGGVAVSLTTTSGDNMYTLDSVDYQTFIGNVTIAEEVEDTADGDDPRSIKKISAAALAFFAILVVIGFSCNLFKARARAAEHHAELLIKKKLQTTQRRATKLASKMSNIMLKDAKVEAANAERERADNPSAAYIVSVGKSKTLPTLEPVRPYNSIKGDGQLMDF